MVKQYAMFTFPQDMVREPVIHTLSQQYNVVTNIRRADISADSGWVVLELEGEESDIEQGIFWVTSKGVRVDPVSDNILESFE